jgi:HSP20 family molecular chaperone IbpA
MYKNFKIINNIPDLPHPYCLDQSLIKSKHAVICPPANIYKSNGKYVIELSAPGFNMENISIEICNNNLTITADKQAYGNTIHYIEHEFNSNKFSRKFILPGNCNINKIDAHCSQGLLVVSIPLH